MATQEELLTQIRDAIYLILSKDGFFIEKMNAEQKTLAKISTTENPTSEK